MSAAVHNTLGFDSMPENLAPTVGTGRGECMNGALKAVEHMRLCGQFHLKGFFIVVAANFASRHCSLLFIALIAAVFSVVLS
jgi:hypothetical protein